MVCTCRGEEIMVRKSVNVAAIRIEENSGPTPNKKRMDVIGED